jgi:ribosomal protein S18 acetylase RimI-like enzyme
MGTFVKGRSEGRAVVVRESAQTHHVLTCAQRSSMAVYQALSIDHELSPTSFWAKIKASSSSQTAVSLLRLQVTTLKDHLAPCSVTSFTPVCKMSQAPSDPPPMLSGIYLKDLASFSPKERQSIVEKVAKIEKKTFPSSEAFDFNTELKKKNTNMVLAMAEGEPGQLVGYLVYLRMKRLALLHKICVVEQEREKGVGRCLIHSLLHHLEKGGCTSIQLWVDEARKPARALYQTFGFQQVDRCLDYYGPGRTGLKMQLSIEK